MRVKLLEIEDIKLIQPPYILHSMRSNFGKYVIIDIYFKRIERFKHYNFWYSFEWLDYSDEETMANMLFILGEDNGMD